MRAIEIEEVNVFSYHLKDIVNIWNEKQKESHGKVAGGIICYGFEEAFLENFF